jgi:hypothetical protein
MPQKLTTKQLIRFLQTQDSHAEITVRTLRGTHYVYGVHDTEIQCVPPAPNIKHSGQHFVFNTNSMICDHCGETKTIIPNLKSPSEQLKDFKHQHKNCTP